MKKLASVISLLLCVVLLAACGGNAETPASPSVDASADLSSAAPSAEPSSEESSKEELTGLWADAVYTENTTFGEGAVAVTVKVEAEGKSVELTVKTDKTTLGDALLEHDLIAGDEGAYGLYVKKVNGITADYDIDQSYWAFNKDGEMMMTGVDGTEIKDGEHYELVYTKG